ncbi:unnamed protein product, partial [Effrenium voratum]
MNCSKSRHKLLFGDGVVYDFKTGEHRAVQSDDRMRLAMACPFKLWVPPPGAPDITQKLCNWLPRAHGALQDDELGREILADLQQLSKECALLKLLFEIFDCWHTTVHFLRNVAVMASAAANFNFLNWVTGAGGAAKDTLLSIVLTAFGEEGDQLGFCEMGRKLTTAVDQRNSVNPVLDAVRGKRTDLPKMLCEQTGASLRAGKRQQLQQFHPMGLMRLQIFELPHAFIGEKVDGELRNKIKSGEFTPQLMYFAVQMYKTLGPDLNRGDTLAPMPPNMDEITEAVISEQFQRRGTLSSFVSERCTQVQRSEATPIQDWRQAAAEYLG